MKSSVANVLRGLHGNRSDMGSRATTSPSRKLCVLTLSLAVMLTVLLITWFTIHTCRNAAGLYSLGDGTFQTYNGVRRMLAGQVPSRDFQFYLGLGPLYLNWIVPAVVERTYVFSNLWTHWSTLLIGCFSVGWYFRLVSRSGLSSVFAALLFLLLGLALYVVGIYVAPVPNTLFFLLPGNSLRPQRFAVVTFVSLALFLLFDRSRTFRRRDPALSAWLGTLAGLSCVWSNDFGLSSAVMLFGITLMISVNRYFLPNLLLFSAACGGVTYALVSLLTAGNFSEWANYLFLNVPKDQGWVFVASGSGGGIGSLRNVITDIASSYPFLLGTLLLLVLAWRLFMRFRRAASPVAPPLDGWASGMAHQVSVFYILGAAFGGSAIYWLFNSAQLFSFFALPLVIFVLAHVWRRIGAERLLERRASLVVAVVVLSLGILSVAVILPAQVGAIPKGLEYDAKVGGRIFGPIHDLKTAAAGTIRPEDSVFSTYSAALQCMRGAFNDTGFDYIIHVLGDRSRARYLADFRRSTPKFVLVPRAMRFSFWSLSQFWFFSKEVFDNYRVRSTDFAKYMLFERRPGGMLLTEKPPVEVETRATGANGVELVFAAPPGCPGLLEVGLHYSISAPWDALKSALLVRQAWIDGENQVSNVSGPASAADFTFLVMIDKEGAGRVALEPLFNHRLRLHAFTTGNLYMNPYLDSAR